jgi:glyoxylase-like metal-dependent hydrolase (beta-lactamase superfamily II)
VTHLVYSHHHADHAGASSLFDPGVVRIGHEETRRLLRDDDPIAGTSVEAHRAGLERVMQACFRREARSSFGRQF